VRFCNSISFIAQFWQVLLIAENFKDNAPGMESSQTIKVKNSKIVVFFIGQIVDQGLQS